MSQESNWRISNPAHGLQRIRIELSKVSASPTITEFCCLLFYLYTLVLASVNPSVGKDPFYYIGIVIGIVLFGIRWYVVISEKKYWNDIFESKILPSAMLFFGISFVIIKGVTSVTIFGRFIQILAPTACLLSFHSLTYRNSLISDSWNPLSQIFEKLKKKKLAFVVLPQIVKEGRVESIQYVYDFPRKSNRITLEDGGFFDDKISIENVPIYIKKNTLGGKPQKHYVVMNSSNLKRLQLSSAEPPHIVDAEQNTLVYLFMKQLFQLSDTENNYLPQQYAANEYLQKGKVKKFRFEGSPSNPEVMIVSHEWKSEQLSQSASMILMSFIQKEKDTSQNLSYVRKTFSKHIKEINKENQIQIPILVNFISILSEQTITQNLTPTRWKGVLQMFGELMPTLIQFRDQFNSFSTLDFQKEMHDCSERIEILSSNPVEEFVKIHDQIVTFLQYVNLEHDENNNQDKLPVFSEIFNKLISIFMRELHQSKFKRKQVFVENYSAMELIEIRKGLVTGAALAMHLLHDFGGFSHG